MSRDKFSFEGLESIERRLIRRASEIGHIVIQDRTNPRKDDTLGRFDFTAECALAYTDLIDPDGEEEPESQADEADDDASEDGEAAQPKPESALAKAAKETPAEEIARAACRWIRDIASRNTVGDKYTRFRVKVWGPKANRMVDSGQFVCRNHEVDLDIPEPADPHLEIPTPTFDQAATSGAARGIKALGDYYAQWGQIVLGSVGQLQGVNNAMMARLHKQLQESRDQVEQLVAAILEYRYQETVSEGHRIHEEREGDARNLLAQQFINQFGEAARVFIAARNVAPEMAEALTVVGGSPELMAALADPDVKALMQNPGNLKMVAAILKQAGQQARAGHSGFPAIESPNPVAV